VSAAATAADRAVRGPIEAIVVQHVEDAAHLWTLRARIIRSARERFAALRRLDDRIAAHLEGVAIAGDVGAALATRALERAGAGEVFVATVSAIEDRDESRLHDVVDIAAGVPAVRSACVSAFGWVSTQRLRGLTGALFASSQSWRRELALAACAMHAVDPGPLLDEALRATDPAVRARAFRAIVPIGRVGLLDACLVGLGDPDRTVALEAARAAAALGDRGSAVAALESAIVSGEATPTAHPHAWRTAWLTLAPARAQRLFAVVRERSETERPVYGAMALVGDPRWLPWLIERMGDERLGAAAAEAFAFVTGVDLAEERLLGERPRANAAAGAGVHDEDEEGDALPWPDAAAVARWWQTHSGAFVPGRRWLAGAEPSIANCTALLAEGSLLQRDVAAEHLSLLAPTRARFDTHAPAWRQRIPLVEPRSRA
jgi:uncharacterized protein (TIGR02270 family)